MGHLNPIHDQPIIIHKRSRVEMQSANNRSARHKAVCGAKPGGASRYYLKEACVPKDQAVADAATARDKAATKKIALREIRKLEEYLHDIAIVMKKTKMDIISPHIINKMVALMVRQDNIEKYPEVGARFEASVKYYNRNHKLWGLPKVSPKSVPLLLHTVMSSAQFLQLAIDTFFTARKRKPAGVAPKSTS